MSDRKVLVMEMRSEPMPDYIAEILLAKAAATMPPTQKLMGVTMTHTCRLEDDVPAREEQHATSSAVETDAV